MNALNQFKNRDSFLFCNALVKVSILVMLGLMLWACSQSDVNTTDVDSNLINAQNSDTARSSGGGTKITGTRISINLPDDQSRFPPGPDMPLVDQTPCLSCHNAGDVAEFQASRSPNYELVKEECTECHSADYSLYQPRQTKVGWEKVVKKMADRFDTSIVNGVPTVDEMLNPVHQALMSDYLTEINGKQ